MPLFMDAHEVSEHSDAAPICGSALVEYARAGTYGGAVERW